MHVVTFHLKNNVGNCTWETGRSEREINIKQSCVQNEIFQNVINSKHQA